MSNEENKLTWLSDQNMKKNIREKGAELGKFVDNTLFWFLRPSWKARIFFQDGQKIVRRNNSAVRFELASDCGYRLCVDHAAINIRFCSHFFDGSRSDFTISILTLQAGVSWCFYSFWDLRPHGCCCSCKSSGSKLLWNDHHKNVIYVKKHLGNYPRYCKNWYLKIHQF